MTGKYVLRIYLVMLSAQMVLNHISEETLTVVVGRRSICSGVARMSGRHQNQKSYVTTIGAIVLFLICVCRNCKKNRSESLGQGQLYSIFKHTFFLSERTDLVQVKERFKQGLVETSFKGEGPIWTRPAFPLLMIWFPRCRCMSVCNVCM